MTSKSSTGQTKKYSGVVKSVKDTQTPEEPRITAEQVVQAFKSFGFEPNERNHNDIGYWTTKGQSEGPKLVEELHKKRKEINDKEDEEKTREHDKQRAHQDFLDKEELTARELEHKQAVGKATMPRLSDQDLAALFDEYGLPAPDPEWARTHLPNDPDKVRSLLEMQRKTADDMLKKHAKNTVNSVPETPKMGAMPGMPATPMPMGGQGGPIGAQGQMVGDQGPATPFFVGDHAIVKITNPTNPEASTMWLVDSKKKVLRPFLSQKAFENAVEDLQEAQKSIITISARELGPGGALDGFKLLQGKQGIKDDGSMDDIPVTEGQLQQRYGKPADPMAENKAMSMIDGIFGKLKGQQPQQPPQQAPLQ